ncbi:uncharacterized protein LOC124914000 [Impatiens glandulifera]|uniref:uncharacterized protein LOC124914000 n=1 Tax=Impatiens glandulifera TaxID=253017 RepID=UPI001FB10F07|nr:uncharacterized protein LOC124914000 [Impatiens glandulifera]
MPSVGMRRSMRVFGTRVLRSGRRLWSAPFGENNHKKSSPSEPEVWIRLLENSSGEGGTIENDQPEDSDSNRDLAAMDIDDKSVSYGSDQNLSFGGDTGNVDRYGLVYRRKRKIADPGDRIFGKKYFRKKWRKRNKRGDVGFSLITESIDGDSSGWLVCFLNLVLRYMSVKANFRLSSLSSFMLSEPLSMIFSSHGILSSWAPSWVTRSGICKISGARCFIPLFTLEFSAVPSCFMYLHSTLLLKSARFPNILENSGMEEDSSDIDDFGQQSSFETTSLVKRDSLLLDSDIGKEDVLENTDSKLTGKSVLYVKKASNSRSKSQKRRSSSRSVRVNNQPTLSVHESKRSSVPCRTPKSPIQKTAESTIKDLKFSLTELIQDIDSTSCGANILVMEPDKCYRVNDVVIKVEMSSPKKWSVVVSKDRILQYNLDAQKIMRPCSTNRVTHDIIWTEDNFSWKLEFPNRRDWVIFKELYRVCFERNFLIATASAIPVPKVQKIPYYDDYENGPFVLPELYISVKGDELTRALTKRTAIYDMDSDDEEWLENFNTESSLVNQQHEQLPMEHFELIIDASEENLTSHPDDNDASDLSIDMANKKVVEAVYSYWVRKRKDNHSTLSRIYQSYRPRRDRLRTKTIIRKKRTSARIPRQPGRDKLLWQSIQNELNALEEQKALHKCVEAKAEASRLEGLAIEQRKRAQLLMENADLATYKALMARRLAEAAAAQSSELMDAVAASLFLE